MSVSGKDTYLNPNSSKQVRQFPSISKPEIIGYFSVDAKRTYHETASHCRYITNSDYQAVRMDLNHGYENVIRKLDEVRDERLDHLLKFIVGNLTKFKNPESNPNKLLSTDFVCFRGMLRMLMCTPYEYREPWIVTATKYKGTIYLWALETTKRRCDREQETEMQKRILSYGFKFEQYMLSDHFNEKPNINEPVNENEEFCCMFRSKLEGIDLIYGAEMDGIESNCEVDLNTMDLNQLNFIELKVKLKAERPNQHRNYLKFNMRNWWCQCFLVNIKKIIVGMRNSDGIIEQISHLDTRDIPKKTQEYWSPPVCVDFCSKFLRLIKDKMANVDNPRTVYRFEYNQDLYKNIQMSIHSNDADLIILPDWYIDKLNN